MATRQQVTAWLDELKAAWEGRDPERALKLFAETERYYERPFRAGTTQAEFRTYWQDIVGLNDIRFDYEVVAIDGDTACVQWGNWFSTPDDPTVQHLDGVFVIEFTADGACRVFRQWWFMEQ